MADTNRRPASTILRETAIKEQTAELTKNIFRENSSEYTANSVPEEIDGSLETRTKLSVINFYGEDNQYRNPDEENV